MRGGASDDGAHMPNLARDPTCDRSHPTHWDTDQFNQKRAWHDRTDSTDEDDLHDTTRTRPDLQAASVAEHRGANHEAARNSMPERGYLRLTKLRATYRPTRIVVNDADWRGGTNPGRQPLG